MRKSIKEVYTKIFEAEFPWHKFDDPDKFKKPAGPVDVGSKRSKPVASPGHTHKKAKYDPKNALAGGSPKVLQGAQRTTFKDILKLHPEFKEEDWSIWLYSDGGKSASAGKNNEHQYEWDDDKWWVKVK